MAISNKTRIGNALDELKPAMISYVEGTLAEELKGPRKADIVQAFQEAEVRMVDGKPHWDVQALVRMIIKLWFPIFSLKYEKLERARNRNLIGEVNEIRNLYAHEMPFSYDDTYRHLDTLSRVADLMGAAAVASKIKDSAKAVMRVQFQEEARSVTRTKASMEGTPLASLKPWREVAPPHEDVAKGAFLEAEFVADLHAVHNHQASSEYGDAREFFARTFLTDGLKDLLKRALTRLHGKGGSPVLELKTNFGGGKTHSLLALYHLFGDTPANQLAGMEELLQEVGVMDAPNARRAVIAGHQLGVNQPRRKPDGTVVRTLWGELAWQLGGAQAFAKVESSDASGTNPGAESLTEVLREAGPCLILIDEWVAYLRDTVEVDGLAGGSFESNFGFAQSLTEAAKVVPTALVVASLPASQIEMGGPKGVSAFNQLSNLFQRVATPWQSTRTEEGYEIVRRRLFKNILEYPSRDAVVKSFAELYQSAKGSFPSNCSEQEYRRKLEACYPIHPELFDKLDSVWSTLEKFQKTRGVLRFMAAVVSELYLREDRNLMIMPASVTLDSPRVSSVIKEVLPNGGSWDGVINADIDGQNAISHVIDSENVSLGKYSACRRVARSIFIAAAPTSGPNRGVDDQHLLLACAQPGENVEKFGDALRRLSDRATYLYRDASRSWFALQPSVLRLAQDRFKDFHQPEKTDVEIKGRLNRWARQRAFPGGVQIAQIPADIPDEIETKLIILPASVSVGKTFEGSTAHVKAEELLTQAANRPRSYRNGLIFLAADDVQLSAVRECAANYLAWSSIEKDKESLELTQHDKIQTEQKKRDADEAFERRLNEAWSQVLVPSAKEPTSREIQWSLVKVSTGSDKVGAVLKKLCDKEVIQDQFSAFHLKRELERHFWTQSDHALVRNVAESFGTYLYFPKLLQPSLLLDAVRKGFGMELRCEYFGYADAFDSEAGVYRGLHINRAPLDIALGESVLIKPDVAMHCYSEAQAKAAKVSEESAPPSSFTAPNAAASPSSETKNENCSAVTAETSEQAPASPALQTRFFGMVDLPAQKVTSSVQKIVDEVLQHLNAKYGSQVRITLSVEAENASGFDESIVRIVSENANTLGFDRKNTGFES